MPLSSDIIEYFQGQLFSTPTPPNTSFEGKTIIITGANTDLGFQCAKHLIKLSVSTFIFACRSLEKGEAAKTELLSTSAKAGTKERRTLDILVWQVVMSSYASVQAFAANLKAIPRLNALVANAGISTTKFELVEGLESTLTVNIISTIVLAILALPTLERTAAATGEETHLSMTGSVVQCFADSSQLKKQGKIFQGLTAEGQALMGGRYFLREPILQLVFQELAKRATGRGVVINIVNPGWCKTELFRQDDGGFSARNLLRLVGWTPEVGGRTLASAIAGGKDTHGQYMSECKVKRASSFARSPEGMRLQKKVWEEITDLLEKQRPGVMDVLA